MGVMVVRHSSHFGFVASASIAELCIVHGVNRYPNSDSKGLSTSSRRCHVFMEDVQRSMYLGKCRCHTQVFFGRIWFDLLS